MSLVSDIKLIRTDTTLDLSQKAEKGIILPSISLLLVPGLCLRLFPVTMGSKPIFTSSALQFPRYGHFQDFEKAVMLSCGKWTSVELRNIGYWKCNIHAQNLMMNQEILSFSVLASRVNYHMIEVRHAQHQHGATWSSWEGLSSFSEIWLMRSSEILK
jgi:hypothetical protein